MFSTTAANITTVFATTAKAFPDEKVGTSAVLQPLLEGIAATLQSGFGEAHRVASIFDRSVGGFVFNTLQAR